MQKRLKTLHVFSITAGAMISSGLFVLPAIVYLRAGNGIIAAYVLAAVLMIPALISKLELATAMPRSGGAYFFIHRSMGPLFGTFSGLASWFSLALKSAFALYGLALLISDIITPFVGPLPQFAIGLIASAAALIFGIMNALSSTKSSNFQVYMVIGLLGIIIMFILFSIPRVNIPEVLMESSIRNFNDIWVATGLIFVSFGGLTKIVSIAEEVEDPGRKLKYGMFGAFGLVSLLYVLAVLVVVGILSPEVLTGSNQPLADAASQSMGAWAEYALRFAAVLAFLTTGNAGLMTASRTPLAMSRDRLLPVGFAHINIKTHTPLRAIVLTTVFMILVLMTLNIEQLVKAASAMMLLLFSFNIVSLIIMRESKIVGYRPLYRSKFYPFIHIIGIVVYVLLFINMGTIPFIISAVFAAIALFWYVFFARTLPQQDSAIAQLVKRISHKKIVPQKLAHELRDILFEREQIVEDRFDELVKNAPVIDIREDMDKDDFFILAGKLLAERLDLSAGQITQLLQEREADSTTAISPGLAIPHLIIPGEKHFDMLICRCRDGIRFNGENDPIHTCFVLAGTADERTFHLKTLVAIAQIVQNKDFQKDWKKVRREDELRELVLLAERSR